jgi:uncharacterized membrane protein
MADTPEAEAHHRRFHAPHAHLATTFGEDWFGRWAERTAHIFGTPAYLVTQTVLVIAWIAVNAAVFALQWDPYPFILLNLVFSTQAAYAAPLILLAQTRQTERDKAWSDADARHREELSQNTLTLIEQNTALLQRNTDLTEQVADLSREVKALTQKIHDTLVKDRP